MVEAIVSSGICAKEQHSLMDRFMMLKAVCSEKQTERDEIGTVAISPAVYFEEQQIALAQKVCLLSLSLT
jgi:hypothetical protein